ncbi:hypothetical protein JCM15765_37000 [Paradesulfitobacterium aromaticivorans]
MFQREYFQKFKNMGDPFVANLFSELEERLKAFDNDAIIVPAFSPKDWIIPIITILAVILYFFIALI